MRNRLMMAAVLAALCVVGWRQPAAAMSDADASRVATTEMQAFEDAYNAAKPADIAAMFVKGGRYLTPGGTMLTDHREMERALAARQKAGWTKETIRLVEAHAVGDDVWSIVTYEIAGTGANAGKQIGGYAAQLLTHEGSDWRFKLIAANLKPVQDVTGMAGATPK